jgi:hypothetical protein
MSDTPRHNFGLWLGPLLGVLGAVSYFGLIIQIGWRSLSDMPWPNLLLVAAAVVLSLLGATRAWKVSPPSIGLRLLAFLGLGLSSFTAYGLIGYIFVGSAQLPSADNVRPAGEPLPTIATSLLDNNGNAFDLAEAARGDLILVFFRGHW